MHIIRHNRYRHLTVIFLLAFIVQTLVPAGFMPSTGDNGKVQLVICTAQGSATILVDAGKVPVKEPAQQDHGKPYDCLFASVLAQGLTGLSPAALPTRIYKDSVSFFPVVLVLQDLKSKPWNAQAPPALLT